MSDELSETLEDLARTFVGLPAWGREQLLQSLAEGGKHDEWLPILMQTHRNLIEE
jgi:hypothetical protein